ncbi:MAG TPA: polysaccharide biosynthesis/export family protein [Candidatus Binatia bacterium]|nr:polysaccharide biosynthesis/export family protein [Candidatus Binatia bacterium]
MLLAGALALAGCGPSVTVAPFSAAELARLHDEAAALETRGYRIEPGDTLLIKYPFHPEMDQETVVRPDGTISASGVGALPAAGLTATELAEELKARTANRLRDPDITVSISKYGERPVYVGGEVGRPGMLVYRKGLTPLQAIVAAGGFLPSARLDSVILVRAGPPNGARRDALVARRLDLKRVVHAGDAESLALFPHDVLFVPRTRIANANIWVRQHITELIPFFRMNMPTMPAGF